MADIDAHTEKEANQFSLNDNNQTCVWGNISIIECHVIPITETMSPIMSMWPIISKLQRGFYYAFWKQKAVPFVQVQMPSIGFCLFYIKSQIFVVVPFVQP